MGEIGSLRRDVEDVSNRKISTLNNFSVKLTLHTTEQDYDIDWNHIKHFDCTRDYLDDIGERYFISFTMPTGDFIHDIYPLRNNLEMTIVINTINGKKEKITFQDKYKCFLSNIHTGVDLPGLMSTPKETLNQGDVFMVDVECISRTLEVLMNLPGICSLSSATVEDAIYYMFQKSLTKSKPTIDGQDVSLKYNIITPHNTLELSVISSMFTPYDDLTLMKFPTYIQDTYGIYNGGIGTFLQKSLSDDGTFNDVIYVYPVYDYESYNNTEIKNKLSIYIPMTGKYDLSEGTFFRDGSVLKAIVSTDSIHQDKGEDDIRILGTEVINIHPKSLVNRSATSNDGEEEMYFNKNKISRSNEISKTSDGTSNVKYIGLSGNMYKERSDMMIGSGIGFNMRWYNGGYLEIYPGMPVCIMRETQKEGIVTYYGKILNVYMSFDRTRNSSIVNLKAIVKKEEKE